MNTPKKITLTLEVTNDELQRWIESCGIEPRRPHQD